MIKQCIKHVTLPLKGTVCYRQICVGACSYWMTIRSDHWENGITGMMGSTLQKINMSLGIITYHPQVDLKLFRIYYYCYIYIYTPSSSWSHHPQWNPRLCGWNQQKCASGVPKSHTAWGNDCHGDRGMERFEWLGGLLIPCCKYI